MAFAAAQQRGKTMNWFKTGFGMTMGHLVAKLVWGIMSIVVVLILVVILLLMA